MKIKTKAAWEGMKVMLFVGLVVSFLMYNTVFGRDKRLFWVIASAFVLAILFKFMQLIREDGGLAFGQFV